MPDEHLATTIDTRRVVEAIRLGVHQVIGPEVELAEITEDTCFWLAGPDEYCVDFDSLDLLELVLFLEEEYGWVIDEERIGSEGWRTVGDLAAMVISVVAEQSDGSATSAAGVT